MIEHRKDLIEQQVEDELLVLDLENGHLHRLNAPAWLVWDGVKAGADQKEIESAYADFFEVNQELASRDVETILRQFADIMLVVFAADTA